MTPEPSWTAPVDTDPTPVTFADYLRVLRTRWLTVVVVTLLTASLLLALAVLRPATYASSAAVLIRPITADPLEGFDASSRLVDVTTERQVAQSSTVAAAARDRLGGDVTADTLLQKLTVEVAEDSHVLRFVQEAGDPQVAADRARAFADAYLAFRTDRAAETLARARTALEDRLADLNEQITALEEEADGLDPDTDASELADIRGRQDVLQTQQALVSNELSQISTAAITAGEVISPAEVPTEPAGPGLPLTLVIAVGVGLVAGLAAAFVRDRADGTLRHADDVARLLDAPVLGRFRDPHPRRRRSPLDLGDASASLRRAAVAVAAGRRGTQPLTVILSSPGPNVDVASTAIGLARSLATRQRTLLVDADPVDADVTRLVGTTRSPGLTDPVREMSALVRPAAPHRPDVLPAGAPGTHEPGDAAATLQQVVGRYHYVVVAAPTADASATALELTEVPGSVLLPVVRLGHTRADDLRTLRQDAAMVGAVVMGVLVIGRFGDRPAAPSAITPRVPAARDTVGTTTPSAPRPSQGARATDDPDDVRPFLAAWTATVPTTPEGPEPRDTTGARPTQTGAARAADPAPAEDTARPVPGPPRADDDRPTRPAPRPTPASTVRDRPRPSPTDGTGPTRTPPAIEASRGAERPGTDDRTDTP